MEWQPIETAPKNGEFLAWSDRRERIFQVFRSGGIMPEEPGHLAVTEPHSGLAFYTRVWMPLPAAPTE